MKVALIQLRSTDDKAYNLEHAAGMIAEAAQGGTDVVVLPEMFCCEYKNSSFIASQEPAGGPAWSMLSAAAKEHRVWIIGGSIPEGDGGWLYNTSFVFDRQGRQAARCRKSHLFDIAVKGGQHFRESDTFTPGDEIVTFDTEFGRLGLCICFDMRFPELARIMALDGALGGILPGQLQHDHGPAHWEIMFRSRAVESQVYTLAAPPRGTWMAAMSATQIHHRPPLGEHNRAGGRRRVHPPRRDNGERGRRHTRAAAAHERQAHRHVQS